jgi:hypothetical protein
MRHLLSVVLSIILAPLIYAAAGLAAIKLGTAHLSSPSIVWSDAAIGLAAGVVAGAGYAVLVMSRMSPLGPALAGLAYLGITIWAYLNPTTFRARVDYTLLGQAHVLIQPVGAGTLLLAIPLLATIFSGRRWAPSQPAGLPYDAAPAYPTAPGSAAPEYGEAPTLIDPIYPTPGYTSAYGAGYLSGSDYPGSVYTPSSSAPTPYSYAPPAPHSYAAPEPATDPSAQPEPPES